MKKIILTINLVLMTLLMLAQAPNSFNYQAAVRDADGKVLANQSVSFRISILENSTTGNIAYSETHTVTSNAQGVVNLSIGNGTIANGDFTTIEWGNTSHFIRTELDAEGGSDYTVMSTQQLMSVPYALNAASAGTISGTVSELSDADKDTRITVEDTADVDNIQFYIKGERMFVFDSSGIDIPNSSNSNLGIGTNVHDSITSGAGNTSLGFVAGKDNVDGYYNTNLGFVAGLSNLGSRNTALGAYSNASNKSGTANTGLGYGTLYVNNNGSFNTAAGDRAMCWGDSLVDNVAMGYNAMAYADTCRLNVGIGSHALYHNSGDRNTAVGEFSMFTNRVGTENVAMGNSSMQTADSGNYNVALGSWTLNSNSGNHNTALGYYSLADNTTGTGNVALGAFCLRANGDGVDNIAIGYSAGSSVTSQRDRISIGAYSQASADDQARIGASVVNSIGGYANWTNVSDGRFKTNVKENVQGLDFIMKLRPVTYNLDVAAIADFTGESAKYSEEDRGRMEAQTAAKSAQIQTGFIAQEVEVAAQKLGYDFSGIDAPKNDKDHYGLRYAEFVVPLVKATQEQQAVIEAQQSVNKELQSQVDVQQAQIEELKRQMALLLEVKNAE